MIVTMVTFYKMRMRMRMRMMREGCDGIADYDGTTGIVRGIGAGRFVYLRDDRVYEFLLTYFPTL